MHAYYPVVVHTLAILALVGAPAALLLLVLQLRPGGRAWLARTFEGAAWWPVAGAWFVALLAMLGSLYLSDVIGFVPCLLCWYQRIAMYPLVLVLGMGMLTRDPRVWRYAIPLPVVGFLIAAYHVALQYQPALDVVSCDASAPCTGRYLAAFGFVSIPVLAGAAFLLIGALLLVARTVAADALDPSRDSIVPPGAPR